MEVRIVIDDRIVNALKRIVTRRRLVALAAVTCLGSALAVAAPGAPVPHIFSDGQVISAAQMNENFAAVTTQIGEVDAAVADTLEPTHFRMQMSASGQTIPADAWTDIDWGIISAADQTGDVDLSSNEFRPSIPGVYVITASVASNDWNGARVGLQLLGGTGSNDAIHESPQADAVYTSIRGTWVVRAAVGDSFKVRVHLNGAPASVAINPAERYTFVEGVRVGP